MIKDLNLPVLLGLLFSASVLIISFVYSDILNLLHPMFRQVASINIIVGWALGAYSIVAFIIGSFMYIIRDINDFWDSLYPVNFGLTLLGVAFWQHNISIPTSWIMVVFSVSVIISFILFKLNTPSRSLLVFLITAFLLSNFINIRFWDGMILGTIFISLPAFEGAITNAFRGKSQGWAAWHEARQDDNVRESQEERLTGAK